MILTEAKLTRTVSAIGHFTKKFVSLDEPVVLRATMVAHLHNFTNEIYWIWQIEPINQSGLKEAIIADFFDNFHSKADKVVYKMTIADYDNIEELYDFLVEIAVEMEDCINEKITSINSGKCDYSEPF